MKLHKLTLKNINSLFGKWEIDFDDDAYRQNGIFGIVGNTGAGKTTLLDAICLAIYRETPRLGKITKNNNALMSIDTIECQAQVELSLTRNNQIQRYIFSFSQARSTRGKSKGELQEPTHEILLQDATGEFKLISEKKSETDKLAIELLGMNFTQFTRSVLLAQGGFSAFLQADSEERGQILEKITGTEIYASIGKKTYEKHKLHKQWIDDKKSKLNDIFVISDDELSDLKTAMDNTESIKSSLNHQLNQLDFKIKKKNQYTQLMTELNSHQNKIQNINNELIDFKPYLIQLNNAKNHNDLLPIFNHLVSIKNKQDELQSQEIQLNLELKDKETELENTKNNLIISQEKFNNSDTIYQEWQPKLLQLKQLDNKLKELHHSYEFNNQTLTTQNHTKAELIQKIHNINTNITQLTQDIDNNQKFLTKYHALSTIQVDDLSTGLVDFMHQLEKLLNKINDLEQKQYKIINLRQQKTHGTKMLGQYCQQTNETTIQDYLNNLDNELAYARAQLNNIDGFIHQFNDLIAKKETLQQKQNQLNNNQTKFQDNELQTKSQETTLQYLKSEYELLEKNYHLSDEIHRLADFIDMLQDGTPCPLCGSTQHPYANNPPNQHDDLNTSKQQLEQKKLALAEFESNHKNMQLQLTELKTTIKYQEQQLMELNDNLINAQTKLSDDWQKLAGLIDSNIIFDELNHDLLMQFKDKFVDINKNKKEMYDNIKNLFEQYKNDKQKYEELCQEWQQEKDNILPIIDLFNPTKHQLWQLINSNYDLICQALNQTASINKYDIDKVFDGVSQLIDLYKQGLKDKDSLNNFYQIFHHLKNEMDNFKINTNAVKNLFLTATNEYNKQNKAYEQNKNNLTHYQSNIQAHQTELQKNEQGLQKIQTTLAQLEYQIQDLSETKRQDFGEIIAENKERALLNQLNIDKDTLNTNKEQLTLITQKVYDLNHRLDENSRQSQLNDKELKDIDNQFRQKLSKSFCDLDEFLNAKLNDDELLNLENQYQTLIDTQKQIGLYLNQTESQLQTLFHNHDDIEHWVLDELEKEFQQTKTKIESLLTDFGTKQEKYNQAIENKQKKLQLIEEIEQLECKFLPLQQLNELIGSSDGKKYRNFAQSLTLTALLNEANIELDKLNKRYLLTASNDEKNILGIDVIDTHQGNAIRQSKNLSGGESFVVSLALALGLSKMSSQKMQIDSLFLDEGFGTLDEEALEMALDALSQIQSDGKMIGIISHINALKERLYTKISVEKKSGGVSVLVGAGVANLGG